MIGAAQPTVRDALCVSGAHEDLHRLARVARALVSEIPEHPRSGSPRDAESRVLRGTDGGGGVARAALLDRLNTDAQILAANLTLVIDAIADCFEVAARRDNHVNTPAVSIIVRTALELAAQAAWLLDDTIDGLTRARRYLVWRFDDLSDRRLLLREFRPDNGDTDSAEADLDSEEAALLADVTDAKWEASATTTNPKGVTPAALLDGGRREGMPKITEMIRLVSSTRSIYGLLSITAHGSRFGLMQGLKADGPPDSRGRRDAQVEGFGLPPNTAIALAVLVVDRACRLLAGWNGVDSSRLHSDALVLMKRAGIT